MNVRPESHNCLPAEIRTPRLLLRRWREDDREPFAALNADPVVLEFLARALTRAESDGFADNIEAHFARHGFGLWAVEAAGVAPFIGYVGLVVPRFEAHFTPCVEIGWRLAYAYWGRGYATEAAAAALAFGFEAAGLDEIVSFTVPENVRSRSVMEKIGMARDPRDDFDHPNLPEGHRLRRHVLYRLRQEDWVRRAADNGPEIQGNA
jgi:RimJ/RimL family protein N-acetyltransferase